MPVSKGDLVRFHERGHHVYARVTYLSRARNLVYLILDRTGKRRVLPIHRVTCLYA